MEEMFLLRHGDSAGGMSGLSKNGIEQINDLAITINEILTDLDDNRYSQENKLLNLSNDYLSSHLYMSSGAKRTDETLDIIVNSIGKNKNIYQLNVARCFDKHISQKLKDAEPILNHINTIGEFYSNGIFVGHNPGISKVVKHYKENEGFKFNQDPQLLEMTLEGGGYHISLIHKTIKHIGIEQ